MSLSRQRLPAWPSVPYVADEHVPVFFGFLLVYGYLVRDVALGRVYAFGDLPPYTGLRALGKFTSAWHHVGLGYAYDYHALPAYMGSVTALGAPLTWLTGGAVDGGALFGNIFFLALVPVGYLGFLRFSARFVDAIPARALGACCYALNPVVVAEFVNGGATTLVVFAGLPFVCHHCWRTAERDRWRAALVAAAAFGLMAVSPWIAFWAVAPFAAVLAYRTRRDRARLGKLVAAGVLGTALTLPGLHHVIQRAAGFEAGRGALQYTLGWNYGDASLVPVLRLAGNQGTLAMNAFGYNDPGAYLVGLVVPLVALVAWHREDLHPFFAVAGVLVAFLVATYRGYTLPLFEAFPPLYSVRNPTKLQVPLAFAVALLFGAGTETLLSHARRVAPMLSALPAERARRVATVAVTGLLLASLLTYVAPASGSFGVEPVRGDDYYVSAATEDVADRVDGRVLWVPYGYTTQLHLRHVKPAHVGIRSGGSLHGIQSVGYVESLFSDFAADPGSVRAQLDSLGVRNVVVARDPPSRVDGGQPRVDFRYGAPWLVGDPSAFERALVESTAYERAFSTDEYAVFRVVGVDGTPRTEQVAGLNAVFYPRSTELYDPPDRNYLANGKFADGLSGWRTGDGGDEYEVVRGPDGFGDRAVRLGTSTWPPATVSQRTRVPDAPLWLSVEADAPVKVTLSWYDGVDTADGPVATTYHTGTDPSAVVQPNGSTVVVSVRPADLSATVDSVELTPARHPPETGLVGNTQGIPGATVDGWAAPNTSATRVAVNLQPWKADRVGADVRVVDAETRLGGRLVHDDRYRQGVAVALPNGTLPDAVPDDARTVVRAGQTGRVLDYWVVGEFDDRPVTVHRTAYHDHWMADGEDHVRADGWANAFVGGSPGAVRWGGPPVRAAVVGTWLMLWAVVVAALYWTRRRF